MAIPLVFICFIWLTPFLDLFFKMISVISFYLFYIGEMLLNYFFEMNLAVVDD
jgi:hypothetical protein